MVEVALVIAVVEGIEVVAVVCAERMAFSSSNLAPNKQTSMAFCSKLYTFC
jgi:hypothetical protein